MLAEYQATSPDLEKDAQAADRKHLHFRDSPKFAQGWRGSGLSAGRSVRVPGTFRVGSEAGRDGPRQDPTRICLSHHGKGDALPRINAALDPDPDL
jgi:hypothetical protein